MWAHLLSHVLGLSTAGMSRLPRQIQRLVNCFLYFLLGVAYIDDHKHFVGFFSCSCYLMNLSVSNLC